MKSVKKRIAEGRCQGIGSDYVPFVMAEEAKSIGTASMIPDPIEGRDVHTLSAVETMLYWYIRWDRNVLHIREQYLMDMDLVNDIRYELGLGLTGSYYTTDFLVDYKDGTQTAFSVKWTEDLFDENSPRYRGRRKKYISMINRQNIERIYWSRMGADFRIVTREMLDRKYASNIAFVMGYYSSACVVNTHQKLLYLIAHRIIDVPMDEGYIQPGRLLNEVDIDVDRVYELTVRTLNSPERR